MKTQNKKIPALGDLLVAQGIITQEELTQKREEALKTVLPLEDVLFHDRRITEDLLQETITAQYNAMEAADQENEQMKKSFLQTVFRNFVKRRRIARMLYAVRKAENAELQKERRAMNFRAQQTLPSQQKSSFRQRMGEKLKQKAETRRKKQKAREEQEREKAERKEKDRQQKIVLQQEQEKIRQKKEAEAKRRHEEVLKKQEEERARRIEEKERRSAEKRRRMEEVRLKKEVEIRQREEEKKRKIEEAKQKKEVMRLAEEEEKKRRIEEKKRREEEKIAAKKEEEQKRMLLAAERAILASARRQERANRRRVFLHRIASFFSMPKTLSLRKDRSSKKISPEQETKQKSVEPSVTPQEQPARSSGESREEGPHYAAQTVFVDAPDQVYVAAPRIVERRDVPRDIRPVTIEERTIFEEEKKRLLAQIEVLERRASFAQPAAVAPTSGKERAMPQREKEELLAVIADLRREIKEKEQNQAAGFRSEAKETGNMQSANVDTNIAILREERQAIAVERALLEREKEDMERMRHEAPASVSAAPAPEEKIVREEVVHISDNEKEKFLERIAELETALQEAAKQPPAKATKQRSAKAAEESVDREKILAEARAEFEAKLKGQQKAFDEENARLRAEAEAAKATSHLPAENVRIVEKEVTSTQPAPADREAVRAELRAEMAGERQALEAMRAQLAEEQRNLNNARSAAPAASLQPATSGEKSAQEKEEIIRLRTELEAKIHEQQTAFAAERKELMSQAAAAQAQASVTSGGNIESVLSEERRRLKEESDQQARATIERERTTWEIEKGRIRQQAVAEAEAEFLSKMKGGGMFGGKQKGALTDEIAKWKVEADKLEKERLALEQEKALHAEQTRMEEEKRRLEQEHLRLEREKIAREKESLASQDTHEEILAEQREALQQEKKELEETKKAREVEQRLEAKKTKKERTEKKTAKNKGGDAEEKEEHPTIDIGAILVAQNYLEQEECERAKKRAEEHKVPFESILREEGLATKEIIQNAIAEYYKMPFVDVRGETPDAEVLALLPVDLAVALRIVVIRKQGDGTLVVATHTPEHSDEIRRRILEVMPDTKKIDLVYTSREAIDSALSFYRKPLETRFRGIIEEHKKIAPEIIEEIFADAIQLGASDIHFEPQEKLIIVRFRVDGVMHEAGRIPKQYYEGIVNRIKIAGNMRIDEHFAAQDGAIRWKQGDRAMDVRVSIVPCVDGEKIVMRLLSEYVRTLTLRDLGFSPEHLDIIVKSAHKPFGMILTTGPTGSGKSTTLYGLMKIRNSPDVNISTIEDPVEYKIPGINHIQVNVKSNLTFERGLRALVRQDPDIILVGEIRDDITAQISVNAALTGHLLFSTLHANDAATAVPRLLEMGLEPYLLASTLELIIAQRLMRRICLNCRYSYNITGGEAQRLFMNAEHYFQDKAAEITLFRGKGCGACGGTGYKGRVGVYEIMPVSQEVETLITERRTSGEINTLARQQGMLTLFEDGLRKALEGFSTIEELLRIAAPPDLLPNLPPPIPHATLRKKDS